jgi:hypothetical protein
MKVNFVWQKCDCKIDGKMWTGFIDNTFKMVENRIESNNISGKDFEMKCKETKKMLSVSISASGHLNLSCFLPPATCLRGTLSILIRKVIKFCKAHVKV